MPFWGLIITSAGFLLPAWVARRKKARFDMCASTTLAATSLLFHSTLHPTIQMVDMTVSHIIGGVNLVRSVINTRKMRRCKDVVGIIATPVCAGLFYGISKGRKGAVAHVGHMALHATAISYWLFYLV